MTHEHWSNYWASGIQTSLPQDFKNNYDGEIYQFWEQVVADIPSGGRILDVCTGNGAVALLLAKIAVATGREFIITAVDISEINTKHIKQNNPTTHTDMIEFISGHAVEDLNKFIAPQQDMIVSQFGLEYSDLTRSAYALSQVIKRQGYLVFITHNVNGDIIHYMNKEKRIYEWLHKIGLIKNCIDYFDNKITANQLIVLIRNVINNHQPPDDFQGQALFAEWVNFIGHIRGLDPYGLNQGKQSIIYFIKQHLAAEKRQQDMLRVADKLTHKKWYQPLLDSGFTLINKAEVIYRERYKMGTAYRMQNK